MLTLHLHRILNVEDILKCLWGHFAAIFEKNISLKKFYIYRETRNDIRLYTAPSFSWISILMIFSRKIPHLLNVNQL